MSDQPKQSAGESPQSLWSRWWMILIFVGVGLIALGAIVGDDDPDTAPIAAGATTTSAPAVPTTGPEAEPTTTADSSTTSTAATTTTRQETTTSDPRDVAIVEGALGPEPQFDPDTAFDAEEALVQAPSGELQPEIPTSFQAQFGARVGEFEAAGVIPGTELEVFQWETSNEKTCAQVVGDDPELRSTGCVDELEDSSERTLTMNFYMTARRINDVVTVWHVSEETSIVLAVAGEEATWQRPRAGVVAMPLDSDTPRVTIQGFDANQEPLTETVFSPQEVADSG